GGGGVKGVGGFGGVGGGGGIAAVSAASLLVSADGARDAVKAQIRAVTGLDPVLRGPVEVSLFPSRSVSLVDVVLGEAGVSPPLPAPAPGAPPRSPTPPLSPSERSP